MTSDAERMVGARLAGRYRLVRLLGEGGMGAVFEATNADGTARCAVKVLSAEFRDDPDVKGRFFDEGRAAARLDHPGIVRVFEAALAEDGTPFLTMEICQGQSLGGLIDKREALPPATAVQMGRGILEALGHAHERGVIHRDLKPENVFVSGDHASPSIKVLDFGLARVMDAAGGVGRRTRTGMLLGTPGYIAPEQLGDARIADARSDLYSVGVMLFELLSGKDPFPSSNPFEKLTIMLTAEAPRIADASPALAPLDGFFRRALAHDPKLRFASAREMSQALVAAAAPLTGPLGAPALAAVSTAQSAPQPPSVPAPPTGGHREVATQLSIPAVQTDVPMRPATPPPGSVRVITATELVREKRTKQVAIGAAIAVTLMIVVVLVLVLTHAI